MDVRLSPEQRALRESAAQVVDRLGPQAVGQLDDAERVAKLDAAVTASGWRELRTAADDDGTPWASGVEVGLVAEELGRGLADVPFLGPTVAAELRRLAGAPPASAPETVALLPDLSTLATTTRADGAARSSSHPETSTEVARGEPPPSRSRGDEPAGGSADDRNGEADGAEGALPPGAVAVDALGASSALVLVPVTGGWALAQVTVPRAGTTTPVDLTRPTLPLDPTIATGADAKATASAGSAIESTASTGRQLTAPAAAAVDARTDAAGSPAGTEPTAGAGADLSPATGTAGVGAIAAGAVAGQRRVLGDDDLVRWTALGLAVTAADLVGTMRGAVHLATEYAKERRQYGRPIGSFQAVQHLLADAHVATEGARSAALHAAWAVDALPPPDALAAAAVAKAYCTRAAQAVCETAIQVHGGIGNTWECLAHVHLRRAVLSGDVLGGVGPNLARVLDHHGIGTNGGQRGLR